MKKEKTERLETDAMVHVTQAIAHLMAAINLLDETAEPITTRGKDALRRSMWQCVDTHVAIQKARDLLWKAER